MPIKPTNTQRTGCHSTRKAADEEYDKLKHAILIYDAHYSLYCILKPGTAFYPNTLIKSK